MIESGILSDGLYKSW